MTQRTRANRTRAAGAVLSAAGFWIGIPALLCRAAGWPLPRRLPSLSELGAAFTGGWTPDDRLVIGVLAVVAWVVWAQIAAGTLAELKAIRSGRRAPTLPFSAWCRPIAIRLATSIALLTPLAPRAAGAAPSPAPAPVTTTVRASGGGEALAAATVSVPNPPVAPVKVHVVRPHDTLWDVAETHLGDPLRWRELFEANRGRLQPDGRRLEDPGLIRPGWKLELPTVTPPEPLTSTGQPEGSSTVLQRSTAEAPCLTAHPPGPDATASVGAGGQVGKPATESPPGTAPKARDTAPAPTGEASGPPRKTTGQGAAAAIAQIGFPSLTAGVLIGYLARLRRDRERRRRHHHRFPAPTPEQTAAERRVRAVARPEAPAWVDLALRHLADSLRQDGAPPPPAILAVRAGELGVEVLISPPWPVAPGRFLPLDDGHTWRLDPAVDLEELAQLTRGLPAYVPGLVTVGDTDSGAVLIDLDEAGTLLVEGEVDQVTGALTAMAAELATAPWSENCDVYVIGLGERLGQLERIRMVDADHAVTELGALAGRPGTGGLRDGALGDIPAGLTIAVVAPGALEGEDLRALLAGAQPHSGLAVITGPGPSDGGGGRFRLIGCPDGTAMLYPLGLSVTLADRSTTAAQFVELLAATATRGTDRPAQPTPPEVQIEDGDHQPTAGSEASPGSEAEAPAESASSLPDAPVVEVHVLGPVEISWQGKTPKRQVGEFVSYLATHPRGVTSDQARLALWPSTTDDDRFGERAPATFWSLTTKARAALGQDRSGNPLILREANSSLRLSPAVACDWIEFEHLVGEASREPDAAAKHLSAALALVRGRPFEGSVWSWVELERLDGVMEATIVDTARDLAALALSNRDLDTARFAVNQGLLAVPQAEALLRWAMRVAAAAGDRAGIERAWRDAKRLATDFDPLGDPEPETVELYESLRQTKHDT